MTNPLKELLPNAEKNAAAEAKKKLAFKSTIKLPKGAMKGLCVSAIDKVLLKKQPLSEVGRILTQSEFDYVIAVLTEYETWLITNGYAKSTELRDDAALQADAAKAIAESA